ESMLQRQLHAILPLFLFSVLLIATILGLLLWHWERRRIQQQEITALNDRTAFERNLFVSGPGTIVKLRNEIGWPVDYISPNIQELLGYPPEAFLQGDMTYSNILAPAYLPQYIRETKAADQARDKIFKRSPYRIVDYDGNHKWVQDISRVIRDKFGNVTHYFAHISDISALKAAEYKLTQSRDYIQKVVDNYQLLLANQSARSLYNGGREIHPATTCYRLCHKRDAPCTGLSDPCPIQEVLLTGKPVSVRHKHFDHLGKLLYIDVRATPLLDNSGQHVEQIVESHRDVTQIVEMEKQLHHMATTDRLTQIFNRLKFDDEIKIQIEWAQANNNPLGLLMFDLDHFKQVNDNYGHDVGDNVLKSTVNLVQQSIRSSDTLARWGGEEFMLITPLTDALELKTIAESLRNRIEKLEHTTAGRVTASFGGSILKAGDSIASLLKRVDAALYQSKQRGRNRCTILE
ncbi:MAG: diguanylate cyclase, partial [Candidatus Thiodiazotropha sp.]